MTMKKSKTIPVVIEEDHHDVLPHIYRSIGSKRLPLNDVTIVHFDSHPDMLIPLEMPADNVKEKQTLFDSLSIENWIIPAVFAGHISHVVWIKPPWCSQVEDKHIQFYVGKCIKTGTIRTTCTESYFLSETLYVPESQLLDKKLLTFTIVSLKPENWDVLEQQAVSNEPSANLDKPKVPHNREKENFEGDKVRCEQEDDIVKADCETLCTDKEKNTNPDDNDSDDSDSEGEQNDVNLNCIPVAKRRKVDHDLREKSEERIQVSDKRLNPHSSSKPVNLISNCLQSATFEGKQYYKSLPELFQELSTLLDGKSYILDIDLDFYSTMNPFQEMYSGRQYKILQELYKYEKPSSESPEDIEKCVAKRHKQLTELKNIFSSLETDADTEIIHPRSDLIKELVLSLKESCAVIDYDLLHDAGCTFDDSDLPHHVSDNTQIAALVDISQEVLSYLPKPTITTIARSSSDDYCPPSQVDFIQESVLNMLQELYLEINVNFAYKEDS